MKTKNLVIVESPTKAKTISKILGDDYSVVFSMGHLIDLPKKKLGVDVDKDFQPSYVVITGRKKILADLKKKAAGDTTVYIATDPDREGEAIGWHIKERIFKNKKVFRVVFHEITLSAVKEAFNHPRDFDYKMIDAQIGRRILDRIVGYFLSPLLWKKITRGLSAGRVQSVALRLIVEREKQINAFLAQEYWEIEAELRTRTKDEGRETKDEREKTSFAAKLDKIEDKKAEIKNKEEAERIAADLKDKNFIVKSILSKEKKRNPDPPFITSTLQQEAFNKLRFNATKTMILAQQLYEGIDLNQEGPVGLITYMRTDSPRVSPEAIKEVRELISCNYGGDYLPKEPNIYKTKKFAQEAHEAIRPTLISRPPESLKQYLTQDQYKLYELVYNRFISSQMNPSRYLATTVNIAAEKYLFTASGSKPVFDGFSIIYNKINAEAEENEEDEGKEKKNQIPALEENESLDLLELIPSEHFTKPPARFSDSSLVKALEEKGIGRPSTYAPIIYTLIQRNYVRRVKGYFHPSELGVKVCDLLVEYFPKVMDIEFTALLEEELDLIEEGKFTRLKVLEDFYKSFKERIDFAQNNIKKEVETTEEVCERCGRPMIFKWGRKGKFLSCSGFPECKNSKSITSGVKCPQPECGGELLERRSTRGFFYGCTNYPKCTYISKTLPEDGKS